MMVKTWMNIVQQSDCVTLGHIKENFTWLINELEEIIWGYFGAILAAMWRYCLI